MIVELLVCSVLVAPMNCDTTNAVFRRQYEVPGQSGVGAIHDGIAAASQDREAVAALAGGKTYPKFRVSVGGSGARG